MDLESNGEAEGFSYGSADDNIGRIFMSFVSPLKLITITAYCLLTVLLWISFSLLVYFLEVFIYEEFIRVAIISSS